MQRGGRRGSDERRRGEAPYSGGRPSRRSQYVPIIKQKSFIRAQWAELQAPRPQGRGVDGKRFEQLVKTILATSSRTGSLRILQATDVFRKVPHEIISHGILMYLKNRKAFAFENDWTPRLRGRNEPFDDGDTDVSVLVVTPEQFEDPSHHEKLRAYYRLKVKEEARAVEEDLKQEDEGATEDVDDDASEVDDLRRLKNEAFMTIEGLDRKTLPYALFGRNCLCKLTRPEFEGEVVELPFLGGGEIKSNRAPLFKGMFQLHEWAFAFNNHVRWGDSVKLFGFLILDDPATFETFYEKVIRFMEQVRQDDAKEDNVRRDFHSLRYIYQMHSAGQLYVVAVDNADAESMIYTLRFQLGSLESKMDKRFDALESRFNDLQHQISENNAMLAAMRELMVKQNQQPQQSEVPAPQDNDADV